LFHSAEPDSLAALSNSTACSNLPALMLALDSVNQVGSDFVGADSAACVMPLKENRSRTVASSFFMGRPLGKDATL